MPIKIIYGDDTYNIRQEISKERSRLIPLDGFEDFNFGEVSDLPKAITASMSPPFGNGNRLVLFKGDIPSNEDTLNLFDGLSIPKNSHLLIVSKSKPDERTKVGKLLKKTCTLQGFNLPSDWQQEDVANSCIKIASDLKIKLSSGAVDAIIKRTGNNTELMASSLQKLVLFTNGQPIKPADVAELMPDINGSIFDCIDAIRQGDSNTALVLFQSLIDANEYPLKLAAAMTSTFRTWLIVKALWESGVKSNQEIAQKAEIGNPGRVHYILQEVRSVSVQWLLLCMRKMLELEVGLKSGEGVDFMKLIIVQLASAEKGK